MYHFSYKNYQTEYASNEHSLVGLNK